MDLRDEIEPVAYELFEKGGRRHGKDEEHWLEAERIVKARHEARKNKAEVTKTEEAPKPARQATGKAPAAKRQEAESKETSAAAKGPTAKRAPGKRAK